MRPFTYKTILQQYQKCINTENWQMKQLEPHSTNAMIAVEPEAKMQQSYKMVNAYNHKASLEQILTITIFLINLAMHCVFIIRSIFEISHPVLYFMWGVFILLLIAIIYDYFLLTCRDPVDKLLQHPQDVTSWKLKQREFTEKYQKQHINKNSHPAKILTSKNPYQLKQCKACQTMVKFDSYHCWTCRRCVENMDHHCKFLNNCIGGRNYFSFFRILLFVIIYFFMGIGIAVWVFVRTFTDPQVQTLCISRWAVLVYIILSLACSVVVQTLCYFHCYISCYLGMTTVQYIYRDSDSNYSSKQNSQVSVNAQMEG